MKSMVRYEEVASDPTAVWRIATVANHKTDMVQHQRGDFQKVMAGMRDQLNRMEILVQRLVNSQARVVEARNMKDLRQSNLESIQGIQLMRTPEGNFKFPSTGPIVVVTGWGEDALPHPPLASNVRQPEDPRKLPEIVQPGELETRDMVQINIISKRGVQIPGIPEGNSNFPSTGYSAAPNCWGQSHLPHTFVASPTLNNLNPNSEPDLARQWHLNPSFYKSLAKGPILDSPEFVGGEPLVEAAVQNKETTMKSFTPGVCKYCGYKWVLGHKCQQNQQVNLMAGDVSDEAQFDLAQLYMVGRANKRLRCTGLFWKTPPWPDDILRKWFDGNTLKSQIEEFFTRYGVGEAAAMCLMLATKLLYAENSLISNADSEKAAEAFEDNGLVGMPQIDGTIALSNTRTQAGGFSMGQVQEAEPLFSGAYEGLCLCSSRLLYPIWELPVMVVRELIDSSDRGEGVVVCRIPTGAMKILESKIRSLETILRSGRNKRRGLYGYVAGLRDSGSLLYKTGPIIGSGVAITEKSLYSYRIRNMGAADLTASAKKPRLLYTSAELTVMEVRAIECLRRLLRRSGEALSLLQLNCQHIVVCLVQTLGNYWRKRSVQLTFHQLVCSEDGDLLVMQLLSAFMGYYIGPQGRGTIDAISTKLRESCPSYFNESDYKYYLAVECLERASMTNNHDEREIFARDTFSLLTRIPDPADLSVICKRFEQLYRTLIEFGLENELLEYGGSDLVAFLQCVGRKHQSVGFGVLLKGANRNGDDKSVEMTKWFDTNYHFIVPELGPSTKFSYSSHKAVNEYKKAKALVVDIVILLVYEEVIAELKIAGVSWIQFDEPTLFLDLDSYQLAAFSVAYTELELAFSGLNVFDKTYFADIPAEPYKTLTFLNSVNAYGLDPFRGTKTLDFDKSVAFPSGKYFLAGQKDDAYFVANAAVQPSGRSPPRVTNEEEESAFEMTNRSIHPNTVFSDTIIGNLFKDGRFMEARNIFDLRVCVGVKADVISYSIMIQGYGFVGKMDEAVKLLDGMVLTGWKPNAFIYITLLDDYCKEGKTEDTTTLFKEMLGKGINIGAITYIIMLDGLIKTWRTAVAKELIKSLKVVYKLQLPEGVGNLSPADAHGKMPTSSMISYLRTSMLLGGGNVRTW